ncbi:MAG: STAS domain-containing protein [Myxococcota bacterium]|nr:STAS domain-containing protein [Myxococcota bacterium]MDP7433712.1 STAS domain-containing protein [Myxococcota bacterium]
MKENPTGRTSTMVSGRLDQTISELIETHKVELAADWIERIKAHPGGRTMDLIDRDTLTRETRALLEALATGFRSESYDNIEHPEFAEAVRLLKDLSTSRAQRGFSPSETATSVLCLKDSLLNILQSEYGTDPERLHTGIIVMNKVIDQLALVTFETFTQVRETLITSQHLALEHSTPVVSIWEGMLLMPLMGIIDTQRAQQIIENLLDTIVSTGSRVAILDLTAVPAFDTRVAQHIIKTVSAAKMLGADVIVTGISPDAAQTLTKLGVDLSILDTCGGLISGVAAGYQRLGKEVRDIGD